MRRPLAAALALLAAGSTAVLAQNFGNISPGTVLGNMGSQSVPAKPLPVESVAGFVDVRRWGAQCVGATHDDTAALNAAGTYSATNKIPIWVPPNCYSSTGVTFPTGAQVKGSITQGNPTTGGAMGSSISCPTTAAAPVCVLLGGPGSGAGKSGQINGLIVSGGQTDTLKIQAGFNYLLDNIQLQGGAANCLHMLSDVANPGIHAKINNITLTGCTSHYVDFDGWPELYGANWRFGVNGTGDVSGTDSYFYIHGGFNSGGSGPNTAVIEGVQFNPGAPGLAPAHLLHFGSITNGASSGPFILSHGYIGQTSGAGLIHFDAGLTNPPFGLHIYDLGCGCGGDNLFSGTPPAALGDFSWSDSTATSFTVNMSGSTTYAGFSLSNMNLGTGALAINGGAGSVANITNVRATGALSVAGNWASLALNAPVPTGAYTNTATGTQTLNTGRLWLDYTPSLVCSGGGTASLAGSGGSPSGGRFQANGRTIAVQFDFITTTSGCLGNLLLATPNFASVAAKSAGAIVGSEVGSGQIIYGLVPAAGNQFNLRTAAGAAPVTTGFHFALSGVYESQ